MSLLIDLHPYEMDNVKQAALIHGKTVNQLIKETLSSIFGGKAAYILLEPAPPIEVVHEIREVINKILSREQKIIHIPKEGDLIIRP